MEFGHTHLIYQIHQVDSNIVFNRSLFKNLDLSDLLIQSIDRIVLNDLVKILPIEVN